MFPTLSSLPLQARAAARAQAGSAGPFAVFAGGPCPNAYAGGNGLDFPGSNLNIAGQVHGNGIINNSGTNNDATAVSYNAACAYTQWNGPDLPFSTPVKPWPTGLPISYETLIAGGTNLSIFAPAECPAVGACDLDLGDSDFASLRRCTVPGGCVVHNDWVSSVDASCLCAGGCDYQILPGVYYFEGLGTLSIARQTCAINVTFVSKQSRLLLGRGIHQVGRVFAVAGGPYTIAGASFKGCLTPAYPCTVFGADRVDALTFAQNVTITGLYLAPHGQAVGSGDSGRIRGGIFADTIKISGSDWAIVGAGTTGAPSAPAVLLVE